MFIFRPIFCTIDWWLVKLGLMGPWGVMISNIFIRELTVNKVLCLGGLWGLIPIADERNSFILLCLMCFCFHEGVSFKRRLLMLSQNDIRNPQGGYFIWSCSLCVTPFSKNKELTLNFKTNHVTRSVVLKLKVVLKQRGICV